MTHYGIVINKEALKRRREIRKKQAKLVAKSASTVYVKKVG